MNTDTKRKIEDAIKLFGSGNLFDNSINLFNTLGYNTERQNPMDKPSYQSFKNYFISDDSKFNETKALINDWDYINLLFQLSKDEALKQTSLFDTKQVIVSGETQSIIETYLFFVIELNGDFYARGELAEITREVNKLFPMPVMILFKYNNFLTLSIINRRLYKKDVSKDVLEKVTLIKDIIIPSNNEEENNHNITHRAHIEILFDLSFEKLYDQYQFKNFVDLHNAWQKTLDTKELNKKFFQELANWYFWAVDETVWPHDVEKKKDVRNATNVIRLITRLIFVWFLKEKNLVPYKLFTRKEVEKLLKFSDPNKSSFYKAILQNLFFATLNTEMGKRKFRKQSDSGRNANYFIHNLFRYKNEFINPEETLKQYFDPIPFLNGGLFECLDTEIEVGSKTKITRVDGFSDRVDNVIKVPDELFFLEKEKEVDLNKFYGTKDKHYRVRGLLEILNSYKFTITENTPIEEEVALDPELLGKVFENLLANYNPETQTTARKQTGSFYTPREIVNYMVDESIIAYLKSKMLEGASSFVQVGFDQSDMFGNKARVGQLKIEEELTTNRWTNKESELETELRKLISYSEEQHIFTVKETDLLIEAIDNCKILDPACGSGAFPMGVLHKLVHILHKLDPENEKWKELQRKKAIAETEEVFNIDANSEREELLKEINETFDTNINYPDYGRKIFLIENCLFGVDIQPIAVQIAKLRFFISLLIEQKVDWTKQDKNYNIKPLPNLETKIVAANTLIGIDKPDGFNFRNKQVEEKEKELSIIRHKHFNARYYKKKVELRRKDEQLRKTIGEIIKKEYEHFCTGVNEDIKREKIKVVAGYKSIESLDKEAKSKNNRKSPEYFINSKEKLRKEIKAAEKKIEKLSSQIEGNSSIEAAADIIANWDPYNHNTSAVFFDPEWMFGLTKGFDIVIGNPPYMKVQTLQLTQPEAMPFYRERFQSARGSFDIYALFVELGIHLSNNNGQLVYILPHKFFQSTFGIELRKILTQKKALRQIVRFGAEQVFDEVTTYTCLLFLTNIQQETFALFEVKSLSEDVLYAIKNRCEHPDYTSSQLNAPLDETWDFSTGAKNIVMQKILNGNITLGDISRKIFVGLQTSSDQIYVLKIIEDNKNEIKCYSKHLDEEIYIEKGLVKTFLMGKDIHRYIKPKAENVVVFPYWIEDGKASLMTQKELRTNFPLGWKYLVKCKNGLEGREHGKMKGDNFYAYIYPKNLVEFDAIKIMTPDICSKPEMTLDEVGNFYHTTTIFSLSIKKDYKIDLKYLLGVLNSKIMWYFQSVTGTILRGGYRRFHKQYISPFPIPKSVNKCEIIIANFVDYILTLKNNNKDSAYFERIIDAIVYELYFPEEIKTAGCEVLKHLTVTPNGVEVLPELKEDWSDEKKLKVIERVYKELSNPNHPVSIAMFKMDTVEEVRIIEGKQ